MTKIFCKLALVVAFCFSDNLKAQSCNPPLNPFLIVDNYNNYAWLEWSAPNSGCSILHYEIEYGYNNFTPGQGEGYLISPVYSSPNFFPDSYVNVAWIRSVCDCDPTGELDGIPDSFSGWVLASVTYVPPPVFPDQGIGCTYAPFITVDPFYACGFSQSYLTFHAIFENEGLQLIPCTGEMEYVIWRKFVAPSSGEVNITMQEYMNSWFDFGLRILAGSCSGEEVFCEASFSSTDIVNVSNLIPGQTYFLGAWNNDYLYYWDFQDNYNGTANNLNICEPELACYPPSSITINQITNASAVCNWTANTENLWSLEFGETGFTPGEGDVISNITTLPFVLSNLDQQTSYDVYVNAECGIDGTSQRIGPVSFITQPSLWVTGSISNTHKFCCDAFSIPESIDVFAYCDSITYTHIDSIAGGECDYNVYRTITASDTCGNSVDYSFEFVVSDNQIPCGCTNGFSISNNIAGNTVTTNGTWAALEKSGGDVMYKWAEGDWIFDSNIDLGNNFYNTLAMDGDVMVARAKVFRLVDDVWAVETNLQSSMGDITSTVSSVHGNTIALKMGERIFIFEYNGIEWNEVAMFDQTCINLDLGEDVLLASGAYGSYVGTVFRKINGTWELEQELLPNNNSAGYELGYEVSIDGDHAAIGNRYFGGVHLYRFNGESWENGDFITNPFLYPGVGYNTAFGSAIDIEGDLMVVGDNMNKTNGHFSGSVVVFEWECDHWSPQRNIVPANGGYNQRFGGCLDLSEDKLVVGIDNTYWLGGNNYTGQGKFWFYSCVQISPEAYNVAVGEDMTLNCTDDIPAAEYELGVGWCAGTNVSISESESNGCGETIVRTYTVTDLSGNSVTGIQTFTFIDNISPEVISFPQDQFLSCDEFAEIVDPVFEDNCSDNIIVDFEETITQNPCSEIHLRIWTATDVCGNVSSVSQTVTLVDVTSPVMTCPQDTLVIIPIGQTVFANFNWLAGTSVIDNCDNIPAMLQSIEPGIALVPGTYNISLTAIDACDNSTVCTFTLTVEQEVGVGESSLSTLLVSPNPTTGLLNVAIGSKEQVSLKLTDMSGRVVLNEKFFGPNFSVNLFGLPNGIYQLSIENENGMMVKKVVLEE